MSTTHIIGTNLGKVVKKSVSWRSGGQALPGLVIEKLMPKYVSKMLNQLPEGVVIVTGTNGKTTTTKVVVELLRSSGKRVLTNPTGSNMTRGIASSIAGQANKRGKLPFDLAVLEVDEASVKNFVKKVKPCWVLALNVSRDQLDRFGEVDYIARLIDMALEQATDGIVLNADDNQLSALGDKYKNTKQVKYFGVSSKLANYFPNDYELASVNDKNIQAVKSAKDSLVVELIDFKNTEAMYKIDNNIHSATTKLTGQHNFQNIAAALALTKQLVPDASTSKMLSDLSTITTPFGRGEIYKYKGKRIELVLVKNPASFRQGLASYTNNKSDLMIMVNDNPADGRDTSWLWDVNFSSLAGKSKIITSGSRAADMALRLSYDDVKVDGVESDYKKALTKLCVGDSPKVIFATYTSMLTLHKHLKSEGNK